MRIFLFLLISFFLSACDGISLDSNDSLFSDDSSDRTFTRPELAFNVLYSSTVLNDSGFSNNRDGFIVLFTSTSELTQIELASDDNDDALVGDYEWDITDDDDLEVTYPDGVVCDTSKTSETASQFTTTSSCSGGEPENDRIQNTLFFPNTFNANSLEGRRVFIENDDQDQQIEFFTNGTYETIDLDSDGDEISGTSVVGNYFDTTDSNTTTELNDVVRLDDSSGSSTLLILLEGSLTDGALMSIEYSSEETDENSLEEVRIYEIETNNRWETDSQYDSITVDN